MEINKNDKLKKLLSNPPEYDLSKNKEREYLTWMANKARKRRPLVVLQDVISAKPALSFAIAAACIFIVILFGIRKTLTPEYPAICNISGTVKVYCSASNEWKFIDSKNVRLMKSDILKTFQDGSVDIVLKGKYHLRLAKNTELRLDEAPSRILKSTISFGLDRGKVFAYYKKIDGNRKEFTIETKEAKIAVLGTDFMVSAMPTSSRTWVGVLDGIVRVSSVHMERMEGATVHVEPGQKTMVLKGKIPVKPKRLMENELLELEELYRVGTKPQVALLISTGKSRTRELLSLTPLFISADADEILPKKIEEIAEDFNEAIKKGTKVSYIENLRLFEDLLKQHPNPKYDVQFLLFIGAYYKHISEYDSSIRTFQRVLDHYPRSYLSSVALCAMGIIYEEYLNNKKLANAAYRKLVTDYPASAEYDEAVNGLRRTSR